MAPAVLVVTAFLFLQLAAPEAASAQAWLPGKGRGNVSIGFKNLYVKYHTDSKGTRFDRGRIRANVVSMDLDYGVTRRLAVNVSLPFSAIKYTGSAPHMDAHTEFLDDGNYHAAVQDFRFGLRYGLVRYSPIVVTPFADGVVPSHNYETFAHAAIGRNLRELLVGTSIGWQGESSFLANAYFQTRISYGFVERVLGYSHNRSNIDAELGYFLTPRLAVSSLASFAKHHGGLDWDSTKGTPAQQWTPEEFLHHDELTRADMLDIGVGASFLVNRSTSVYATVLHTPWAINGHPLHVGVMAGINWRFRSRRTPEAESSPDQSLPATPERR